MNLRIGSLCTGVGGLDLAVEAHYGATPAWFAEFDPAPSKVLAHHWPDVPNLRDLTAVDWRRVEPVDLLIGGIPCQPFSVAGKRTALGDPRHLWPYMADAVRVLRPRVVIVENVSGFIPNGGLGAVLTDLAALGYDAQWVSVRASDVGAPHRRERVFLAAQDADGTARRERRLAAPGQAEGRWARADAGGRGGAPAADAGSERHGGGVHATGVGRVDGPDAGSSRERERPRPVAGDRGAATAPDADVDGLSLVRRLNTFERDAHRRGSADVAWGAYEPAIRRWERTLGRRAPAPTGAGRDGRPRLSPALVEWMMGLPAGHVTDPAIGLSRNAQLKALGNGVVPQQAAHALRLLDEIAQVAA